MHAADIRGSIAYTKSLALIGILTKAEEKKIIDGLETVGKEWDDGVVNISGILVLTFIDQTLFTISFRHRKMMKTSIQLMNAV